MDLAEYRTLFVFSFTNPAFDSDVAPSFGTLLATINVALSMLGEVVVPAPPHPCCVRPSTLFHCVLREGPVVE